jgi:hypothetical protein
MAIEDRTIPYELLVRFNPDGTIAGSHFQKRRVLSEQGTVISDQLLEPVSLAAVASADGTDRELLANAVGDAITSAAQTVDKARADLGAAQATVADRDQSIEVLSGRVEQLTFELAEGRRMVESLNGQIAALQTKEQDQNVTATG